MGSKDILKLLLRAGKVDTNSQDLNGRTTIILGRRGPWLPDSERSGLLRDNWNDHEGVKITTQDWCG